VSERWNQARASIKFARDIAKDAAKRAVHAAQDALISDAPARPKASAPSETTLQSTTRSDLVQEGPEPPVVARLMVEIRSDGSRTIARGALHDELTGEQVAVEARGNSPLELAGQLAKSLVTAPLSLGTLRKAWLTSKKP
jgi:hypothetical protein